jgi:hypothetical protein
MKSLKQLSRNQRMGLFFGAIGATVLLSYQNCAEVQFIDPTGAQKNAATGTVTTRVITLKPSASSSTPTTPAKILLVIDNSKSMVGTQEKLRATGLGQNHYDVVRCQCSRSRRTGMVGQKHDS